MAVGSGIALHPDGSHAGQDREVLLNFYAALLHFFADNSVGLPQGIGPLLRYLPDNAHRQTGTGEGLPLGNGPMQAKHPADLPDLVFIQFPQRFY